MTIEDGRVGQPFPTFSRGRYTHHRNLDEEFHIHDDRELVERLLDGGSEWAFLGLYERHTPRLMRFVARVAGWADPARVEDLVQETWIRGVSGLSGFDWRSSLATWLQGIALNVAREALRADRRLQLDDGAGEAIDQLAAGRPSDHEGRIDLERALRQLPERRRVVLILHDLEGYTHAEIARTLDISAGTSKSQLHDARLQLEELLTEDGHDA